MAKNTRQRIIDATGRLLHQHGFHGTSLNAILDEAGAPRGSLYFHFPGGKDEIVLEATRASVAVITRELQQTLDETGDPVAAVRAYVAAAAGELRGSDYLFGCPVAPVILDSPAAASPLAEFCRETLANWHRLYQEALVTAGIGPDRAAALATMINASLEGALLMARAERDTAALDVIADELAAMIEAARSRAG